MGDGATHKYESHSWLAVRYPMTNDYYIIYSLVFVGLLKVSHDFYLCDTTSSSTCKGINNIHVFCVAASQETGDLTTLFKMGSSNSSSGIPTNIYQPINQCGISGGLDWQQFAFQMILAKVVRSCYFSQLLKITMTIRWPIFGRKTYLFVIW